MKIMPQTSLIYTVAPPEVSWTERLRPWREAAEEYAVQASEEPKPDDAPRSSQCPHVQR